MRQPRVLQAGARHQPSWNEVTHERIWLVTDLLRPSSFSVAELEEYCGLVTRICSVAGVLGL